MILSCFGNASMGELANAKTLTLNNIKSLSFKGSLIDGGPCTIPGFQPPNLPNFQIPPIPLFGGIPPFPTLCFLPPFPGIPALSLPPISIPIPPIPMIPPIPLPIPGFSLPFLPLLPVFDLGSLSFLCGLINIDLPVLDPFAFLNDLIKKLNALIAALNDFLKFCEENAEVKATTEAPETNFPAAPTPSLVVPKPFALSLNKSLSQTSPTTPPSGLNLSQPIEIGDSSATAASPSSFDQPLVSDQAIVDAFNNMTIAEDDPAEQLAFYLANENVFPPEPSIINQVAALLAPLGLATSVSPLQVAVILLENNIPSAEGFIGFTTQAIQPVLDASSNAQEFAQNLLSFGLVADNQEIKEKLLAVLTGSDKAIPISGASGAALPIPSTTPIAGSIADGIQDGTLSALTIAILLNAAGIPFGKNAKSLARIKPLDVARAFFIRHTTLPFTPEKVNKVLTLTGIISNAGNNVEKALDQLSELPTSLTPDTIAIALSGILAGPGIDSLKASCIASTRGTSAPQVLSEMNKARENALLQSVRDLKKTTLVQALSSMTFKEFSFKLKSAEVEFIFPLSIWEMIPALSVIFEVDDQAWYDLLSQFDVPALFFSLEGLFSFVSASAKVLQSEASAQRAIATCYDTQESDFNYSRLVEDITKACQKFSILLPTTQRANRDIANALQIELGYSSISVANSLGTDIFNTFDEVTFRLLASGALVGQTQTADQQSISLQTQSGLSLSVGIQSPTNVVGDIQQSSIQVTMTTKKFTSAGVLDQHYEIIKNGSPTPGTTIALQYNDITQTLEIRVLRINGFVPNFEAIASIEVLAEYATLVRPTPERIPSHLISIKF